MNNKTLTIIVPTYNMEKYLNQCLSSLVCNKKCMDLMEVLVINDGSTDSSSQIAHQYETKRPDTFKVVDKENGNYGSCINVGLSIASGQYVKILDADDWFNTSNLSDFVTFLANSDADMIISDYAIFNNNGEQIDYFSFPFKGGSLSDYLQYDISSMQMHAVTYKTDNLRTIKYHQSENLSYTDQEWLFLPMITVNRIDRYDKMIYQYRMGREGQTMDPIVFEKNFWQEIEVSKHIITSFIGLDKAYISEFQLQYLELKLKDRISAIYHYYFKKFRNGINTEEVIQYDQFVKEVLPEFYSVFDDYTWNEGRFLKNYHYIKAWRKHYGYLTPLLRLANFYAFFYKRIVKRTSK